ncbi:GNAT family N-acetyltransferase [Bacillus horti]|uniref:L-amino acid N-acyltransferase YncA n=2 Tax=Caldalkalibacillus horti TaxID=77523 RepID=A0ABT9W522_9BACI|nr:L-amino acid N-acyltransferase YncA [Bacillus horti]
MANVDDAPGIAEVHVASWKTTYKGIIDATLLDQLSIERRLQNWRQTLSIADEGSQNEQDEISSTSSLNNNEFVYVAEDEEGRIVAFASAGQSRSPQYPYKAELYTIYLLEEVQKQGIGQKLFKAVVQELHSRSYSSMLCWVIKDNSAVSFYQKHGGKIIDEKMFEFGHQQIPEYAVGWDELM